MDDKLRSHFQKLKEEDAALDTPELQSMIPETSERIRPEMVAFVLISILVLVAVFWSRDQTDEPEPLPVENQVADVVEFQSSYLLNTETDIMEWESSTDYLLDD